MKRVMWWKNRRPIDFAWSKQLSVGNVLLDSEHRNLIAKINNIMHMIEARDTAALSDTFGMLEIWLIAHFENEKIIAQSLNFDFEQHRLAQQRSLNELQCLRDELAAKNWVISGSEIRSCYKLMPDWLIRHIKDCMRMKPALQSRPYNYIPSGLEA